MPTSVGVAAKMVEDEGQKIYNNFYLGGGGGGGGAGSL